MLLSSTMDGEPGARGSVLEVFGAFLRLGLTSFGGPIAHLGYFRTEFVERRRWMADADYADLVALCQFLPGPASSQVGFAIGAHRAGMRGALAAFVGFTAPSAIAMVAFAFGARLFDGPVGQAVLSGLQIVAVAIVAQAVWGMARTLTPDRSRAGIAVAAAVIALAAPGSLGQVAAIAVGAIAGTILCRGATGTAGGLHLRVRRSVALTCLALWALLLLGSPVLAEATGIGGIRLFDAFFRAGALVFGGGHVVLPLLQAGVVDTGWVSASQFLAGYGAAQAVPGPLFTFAGYLAAVSTVGPGGVWGALIALGAIFLPGFLLLVGILPFWNRLRSRPGMQAAMRGASAAVVGILAAALYTPVFTTAITGPGPFCLALVCFVLLTAWRLPPWAVVIVGAVGGVLLLGVERLTLG